MASPNKGISIPRSALDALEAQFPDPAKPITMLNLLRFRSVAQYPPSSPSSVPSISGREAYLTRYVPAFQTLAGQISDTIRPMFLGTPTFDLVTRDSVAIDLSNEDSTYHQARPQDWAGTHWDLVGLVSYPSFQAFRDLVESAEYLAEADLHRRASLSDWRLIATRAVDPADM